MADKTGYIGRNPGDSSVMIARESFSPSGSTTEFTFTPGYEVGYVDVFQNGLRLLEGTEFTASDSSKVVLATAVGSGTTVEVVAYKSFSLQSVEVQSATNDFTVGGDLTVGGQSNLGSTVIVGSAVTFQHNSGINVTGVVTATSFSGDGSNLSGLQAGYFVETQAGINTLSSVGIGTTNPADILDVAGAVPQIRLTDTSDTSYGQIRANGGNLVLRADEGDDIASSLIVLEIDGDEQARLDSGAKLHLGSSNNTGANTKLVVGSGNDINTTTAIFTGDVDVDALTLSNWDGSTATTKCTMHFDSSGVGGFNIGMPAAVDAFMIEDDGGSEALRIGANGVVAIGTDKITGNGSLCRVATPLRTLTEDLPDGGIIIVPTGATVATGEVMPVFSVGGDGANPGIARAGIAAVSTNGRSAMDMVFCTRSAADGTSLDVTDDEQVRITSSGRVGINSDVPQNTLDVFGTGTGPIFRAFTSSGSDSTPVQIQGNGGLYMQWKPSETGGAKHNWAIGCQQNVDNAFEITPSTAADGTTFSTPSLVMDKDGHVYPGADVNGDLGRPSYRWANIYTADMQLSNEGSQNEIDGTWGNYTIQEGEDDLFLINRRTGKKYKFMLEEVQ